MLFTHLLTRPPIYACTCLQDITQSIWCEALQEGSRLRFTGKEYHPRGLIHLKLRIARILFRVLISDRNEGALNVQRHPQEGLHFQGNYRSLFRNNP